MGNDYDHKVTELVRSGANDLLDREHGGDTFVKLNESAGFSKALAELLAKSSEETGLGPVSTIREAAATLTATYGKLLLDGWTDDNYGDRLVEAATNETNRLIETVWETTRGLAAVYEGLGGNPNELYDEATKCERELLQQLTEGIAKVREKFPIKRTETGGFVPEDDDHDSWWGDDWDDHDYDDDYYAEEEDEDYFDEPGDTIRDLAKKAPYHPNQGVTVPTVGPNQDDVRFTAITGLQESSDRRSE